MSKKASQNRNRRRQGGFAETPATATKRPEAEQDTAERMVRALEAIATHLSAASSAPANAADLFESADAFVWHPDGRLAPVPRVSRVDLGLLKGSSGCATS